MKTPDQGGKPNEYSVIAEAEKVAQRTSDRRERREAVEEVASYMTLCILLISDLLATKSGDGAATYVFSFGIFYNLVFIAGEVSRNFSETDDATDDE